MHDNTFMPTPAITPLIPPPDLSHLSPQQIDLAACTLEFVRLMLEPPGDDDADSADRGSA
ncbi:hypothetical protein OAS39_00635 [Pirellulales bacterium]|nr:hypothetical protein [Pirellulales bacterium]